MIQICGFVAPLFKCDWFLKETIFQGVVLQKPDIATPLQTGATGDVLGSDVTASVSANRAYQRRGSASEVARFDAFGCGDAGARKRKRGEAGGKQGKKKKDDEEGEGEGEGKKEE